MATLTGTSGDDRLLLVLADGSGNTLLGLGGNDDLDASGGAGNNILRGGDGNDVLYAYQNDQLYGEAGNDTLNSDGKGFNTLSGGDGNDTIFADVSDTVLGDAGDDIIYASGGNNQLTGGAGSDTFYITPAGVQTSPNTILDFTKGQDKVLLSGVAEIQSFNDLIRVQSGSDTVLRAIVGGTPTDLGILKNVQANSLIASDFGFGPVPVNNPPDANPDKTITLLQDAQPTALGITAPTDADSDPLTLMVNSIPDSAKGKIILSDGTAVTVGKILTLDQLVSLVFVPTAKANGAAGTFSYSVSDGRGGSDTQTVTFNITPVTNGGSVGDPHIFTFDGLNYDFQATGDFFLVKDLTSDLQIQTRQTPWALNQGTTINTGLATIVDGNRVELYSDNSTLWVDGLQVNLALGESQSLGKGSISRTSISGYGVTGDLYTISYGTGDVLKSAVYGGFLIDPILDLAGSHSVVGLLGNNNGRTDDDLALRDGTVLSEPLAPETLYGAFTEAWKVTQSESLFSSPAALKGSFDQGADLSTLAQKYVFGGNGNDFLTGGGASGAAGQPVTDIFMGNKGADTFVLGDQAHSFYNTAGVGDYALITDLWSEDRIQLHGSAENYVLGTVPTDLANGTGIFLSNNPNELIGIIQSRIADTLSLTDALTFTYI